MEFRELTSDADLDAAFPLARELRDRLRPETFVREVRRQQLEGYRLYGFFREGSLVSLAGVRRTHTLARGEHLFVDDLVTAQPAQGKGYGRETLRALARMAAEQGVARIYLDSRFTAKGFYTKLGFTHLTSIPSWIEVKDLA